MLIQIHINLKVGQKSFEWAWLNMGVAILVMGM